MKVIFTLCSNNYLAQALVLFRSVQEHEPQAHFVIGLTDQKHEQIDYAAFGCEVLEVAQVEKHIESLAKKFSIIELNTCVKPRYFQYFLEHLQAEQVIYLDPDICVYQPLQEIDRQLRDADFLVTPHIHTPLPIDSHTPKENLFLSYGIFNLGFLAVRNTKQVLEFMQWWKERTYEFGYNKPLAGYFTDQLWINFLPVYFKQVSQLSHPGYNMAPWNLHERWLDNEEGYYRVNRAQGLVFYHFSSFNPAQQKLHREYTRYQWADRPDLHALHTNYGQRLQDENYHLYKTFPCFYAAVHERFLREQRALQEKQAAETFSKLPYHIRMTRNLKKMIPKPLKQFTLNLIKT